ncbi:EamA family transporter [Arthrobacter sp. NPDC090010]|uniref:EamA family transporter n=1 Tax=Arthrobacter sp. NPDC090010 TaxID=3363942 RepID=UPI0037FC0977
MGLIPTRNAALPPWLPAIVAMFSAQFCSALSIGLIELIGPAGTAWLRLCMGALIFLAIARPPLRSVRRQDIVPLLGLGAASGGMIVFYMAAIDRIPLGTAVAIEFMGPLVVAAVRSHALRMVFWPVLALAGVVLLTEPWHGQVDLLGVGFAVLAGISWACYILLTQKVGDRFSGLSGLSMTVPVAAVVTSFVGIPQAAGQISWGVLAAAFGLALMAPVLLFALEMYAIRRMTATAFGTLMALEPAFGLLLGLAVLHQVPSALQVTGIVLVVLAAAGAQRGGTRTSRPEPVAVPLD